MNESSEVIQIDKLHRGRWGRRIALALLVLLVTLFGVHAIWLRAAGRHLRNRLAALESAGEPVRPEDLQPKVPDGPDNAVGDLLAAGSLLAEHRDDELFKDFQRRTFDLQLRGREREIIAAIITASEAPLALVEVASTKPRIDWYADLSVPFIDRLLPELNQFRLIANILRARALFDHEDRHDGAAVRSVERILFVSRCLDRHGTIVGALVATGCAAMAASTTDSISGDLAIGTGPNDASPADIRRLIETLLEDGSAILGVQHAFRGERVMQLEVMQSLGSPNSTSSGGAAGNLLPRSAIMQYLLSPVLDNNARMMVEQSSGFIPAVAARDLPSALALRPVRPPQLAEGSVMYAFAKILSPPYDRVLESHYRARTDRRMAAIALAIRWYAVEHDGQLPQTLDELAPKYLPAVPIDPMAAGGRQIGFKPDVDDPTLFSVGSNAVDEGGDETPTRKYNDIKDVSEWARRDRVVHLKHRPRLPDEMDEAPATSPGD